jgi:hypothetical protein
MIVCLPVNLPTVCAGALCAGLVGNWPRKTQPACADLLLGGGQVLEAREGGPAGIAGVRGTSRDKYGRLVRSPRPTASCVWNDLEC